MREKELKKRDLLQKKDEAEDAIKELNIDNLESSAIWMKQLAVNQKKNAGKKLSELGTTSLQYSFGPDYEMQIEMEGSAKRSTGKVWIIKDGKEDEKEDPMEDNGGGIVDIVGTSMRLMTLDSYNEPKIDGPIILDEPFKMVSDEYIPAQSEFLSKVHRDFGRQVIAVTHNDYLTSTVASHVYVSLDEDKNSVVEIRNEGALK